LAGILYIYLSDRAAKIFAAEGASTPVNEEEEEESEEKPERTLWQHIKTIREFPVTFWLACLQSAFFYGAVFPFGVVSTYVKLSFFSFLFLFFFLRLRGLEFSFQ
jgi:hypothetical protein